MKKKVVVYSGGRADYYILKPLIKELSKVININLIAGPHHFAKEFGSTYKNIKQDKIKIINNKKLILDYKNVNIPKFIQNSILHYYTLLKKINPKLIIVLGDRYELLPLCLSAFFLNIQIAHLHGGEKTQGSFDDTIRHLITKLSHYHFVCADKYAERIVSMGENKENVFNFGSIGSTNATRVHLINKNKLKNLFNIKKNLELILVTFHPETNSLIGYNKQIKIFIDGLKKINNSFFIFTASNGDPGGNIFNNYIKHFIKNNKNSIYIETCGEKLYFSLMKHCDLMIGNSSSGIIESPIFKTKVINVGTRQTGRIMPKNVYSTELNSNKIFISAIKLLKNNKINNINNPFYKKNSVKLIKNKILKILNKQKINFKVFND